MLQVSYIRENKEQVVKGLEKRLFKDFHLLDQVIDLDENRKKIQLSLDNTLAELNQLSKEIGELYKKSEVEKANGLKQKTVDLKKNSKTAQTKLNTIVKELNETLHQIPNIPNKWVVKGKNEDDNEVIFQVENIPSLDESAKSHWDLIKDFDLIDFELGNKITGAGFPVYTGKGARLQRALVNYFLDYNTNAGYKEIQPPHLVNEASGFGTGQLPDKEGQMYHATADNLYLIPTSEIPLTNIYRDVILKENDFPIKMTAYTPCFRREAGSWGAHVRGLNRLHQFDKVEVVRIEKPENSYAVLDEMVKHVETLLKNLELPYRILRLCGGDTGFTSALTYDFEVYSAAQKRWLEVSSVSNFETFQANRLKLKYKSVEKGTQLCHTLNGSSLALPRIIAALLENNQTEKGIKIPTVLQNYTGFEMI